MPHSPDDLANASNKLEFHVTMYVGAYKWLHDWKAEGEKHSIASNAVEDSHLVHARILIQFLTNHRRFPTDVLAEDFAAPADSERVWLDDDYLQKWSRKIGGRLVHLTTRDLTELISDFEWPREEIAGRLAQPLRHFFTDASDTKFRNRDRKQCLDHLEMLDSLLA